MINKFHSSTSYLGCTVSTIFKLINLQIDLYFYVAIIQTIHLLHCAAPIMRALLKIIMYTYSSFALKNTLPTYCYNLKSLHTNYCCRVLKTNIVHIFFHTIAKTEIDCLMSDLLNTLNEIDSAENTQSFLCDACDLTQLIKFQSGDLTIVSQNICSVYKNFSDLLLSIAQINVDPDVIILTECFTNDDKPIPLTASYTYHYTTRHFNKNDGVIAYIKENITVSSREIALDDVTCLQLELPSCIIIALYRSPSITNADNFIASLDLHLKLIKSNKCVVVVGDININTIYKDNENSTNRKNRYNYLHMLSTHSILPGHNLPTRKDRCLDHMMLRLDKNKVTACVAVLRTSIA